MADDLLQLLHGLGAGQSLGVYGRARAFTYWIHRVHVFGLAHGLVVLDAPALVVLFLTVVFVSSLRVPKWCASRRFAKQVLQACACSSAFSAVERAKR